MEDTDREASELIIDLIRTNLVIGYKEDLKTLQPLPLQLIQMA
jgi:hypothetical protein